MLKDKLFFLVFLFILHSAGAQNVNQNIKGISEENQKKFEHLIEINLLDSAYRFLQAYDLNTLDYYLNWKTLAYAYWEKDDLANSFAIISWVGNNTGLFKKPNELYPQTHHLIGNIYFRQGKSDSAIANYKRTIYYREKYVHIHDTALLNTYQNLSQVYSRMNDSANTFLFLEKAKDIVYLQSNNVVQIASIHGRYADSYSRLRHFDLAQLYYKEAFEMLNEEKKEHFEELAELYTQKGRLYYYLGKFTEAINSYSKSLVFLEKSNGPPLSIANAMEQLADVYYMLKDYESALKLYLKAFDISIKILPETDGRIVNLHTDLAAVYNGMESYAQAIKHFYSASSKRKLSSYQYRIFGETLWKTDSLDKAEKLLKFANSLAESGPNYTKKEIADTHFWLGSFYLETERDKMLGLFYLNLAVGGYKTSLGEKNEELGRALLALSKYFIRENDTKNALEIIQASIIAMSPGFYSKDPLINPMRYQMGSTSITNSIGWKALALAKHYEKTKEIKYLKAAFESYQLSLKMVESYRFSQKYTSNIILNKEVNTLLNQAISVSHKLYKLTDDKKYFNATFSFIEQNKSTALLASLQRNDSIYLSNVPVDIIEKENQFKQSLLSLQEKTNPFITSKTQNQKLIFAYQEQKQKVQSSLDSIQKVLSIIAPNYYRLFYGNNIISIEEVQDKLSKDKALIDYAITDSLLMIYVISKDEAELYTKKIPTGFNNSILRLLQLIRFVNTDNSQPDFVSFNALSHEMYLLLINDFSKRIKGKDLLIVPDGILSYLPFDVLLTEKVESIRPDYRNLPYLIRKNVTSSLNSAAIYFTYLQKKVPNHGQIIAFAPKYNFFSGNTPATNANYDLLPLPHVKREIESISQSFNPKIFSGSRASKDNFNNYAPKASVLHLAMHAVLNDEEPLKSQLVFSPNNNFSEDDLFTVSELFGIRLSADLAVLSACNSGNGKLNKGEGIMSLSTGFQYAGVPSVIMTHWDVNDKFSADLMASFYTYLAKGLEKNKGLHRAKMDVITKGNSMYSHPYYWAGFTLIGNESAIVSSKSGASRSLEIIISILIILAFFLRKYLFSNE